MAIVINGSGTVTGLSVGGLPDGVVDSDTLASNAVVTGKIADGTIANADINDLAASKLTGALPAISGASLTGLSSGLSGADLWRLTSNSSGNFVVNSNVERSDDAHFTKIGTGVSHSSGKWSFPDTGIWLVRVNWGAENNAVTDPIFYISTTSNDGSSWDVDAKCYAGSIGSGWMKMSTSAEIIFDVTNVSTHKVKFEVGNANSNVITQSDTNNNWTYFTFFRLGDT